MSLRTAIVTAVWTACVALAIGRLQVYANTPGEAKPAPRVLTLELINQSQGQKAIPRVYLFLHERCPCSRASIEELARHPQLREDALVSVVFSGPATGTDRSRALRELVEHRLPDALVREDPSGDLARRFGAHTSGHTVLYSADGKLRFAGGLTPTRAHQGPCAGRTALVTLTGDPTDPTDQATSAPVFGCPLFSDACEDAEYCGDPTP